MKKLALSCVLLFLCSCASTAKLSDMPLKSREKNAPIEVFYDKKPTREYIEVALVTDESDGGDEAGRMESLKRQARRVGADAIILEHIQRVDSGASIINWGFGLSRAQATTKTVARGIAIVWK